jgi:hypothetical protein
VQKSIWVGIVFTIGLLMSACSTSNSSSNINGNWKASLTNTDGSPAYAFSTTFTEASNGSVDITNFSFTSAGSCFSGDTTSETGSFNLSGNFNGNVSGSFGMNISTAFPGAATQNVLALQGTVAGRSIGGTWTLTGASGCSGHGTFNISKA